MNLDFSNLSRIEMSVYIRDIYNRVINAMGYSPIDSCYIHAIIICSMVCTMLINSTSHLV